MTEPDRLAELAARRTEAIEQAARADLFWRWEIQRQVKAGRAVAEIAAVAGVTRARIYQIRDGKR